MSIFINIVCSLFFFMGFVWAYIPGELGLINYKKAHSNTLGRVATIVWVSLMLIHPIAIYMLWTTSFSVLWLFLITVAFQILFFTVFGKNLSAA